MGALILLASLCAIFGLMVALVLHFDPEAGGHATRQREHARTERP